MLATITVDSLADNLTVDGLVTLREAIAAANSDSAVGDAPAGSGTDTINFQPGLSGTISMSLGEFLLSDSVTIDGPDANVIAIDAQAASRVFNVDDGGAGGIDVEISGLTLTGGSATNGGAIRSAENTTVTRSVISGNTATGFGGGIYAVDMNLTVQASILSGNSATDGGGIFATPVTGTTMTVRDTTVTGNTAAANAGGIEFVNFGGSVVIERSTISNNSSFASGGGILGLNPVGSAVIENSTISGNSSGAVGGVFADGVSIRHSTITNNSALSTGGGVYAPASPVAPVIENSIIAGNSDASGFAPDLNVASFGTLTVRYSLIGDNSGSGLAEAAPDASGNLVGGPLGGLIDPQLGPLVNSGRKTAVHNLLAGSPALDAGDPAFAAPPSTDQRGAPFVRVAGGRIDLGSVEKQTLALLVDSVADESDDDFGVGDLSLREAIELSNLNPDVDAISFDTAGLFAAPQTITLALGELAISDSTTIGGPGAALVAIDGNGASRIFNIDDGDLGTQIDASISGLTLTGGTAAPSLRGGAIYSLENLSLSGLQIVGNSAGIGGGIASSIPGGVPNVTISIQDTIVSGNSVPSIGAGIHIETRDGNVEIIRSTIDGNTSNASGGGGWIQEFAAGSVKVEDSTFSNNVANLGNAGGLTVSLISAAGTGEIINSTISGNSAGNIAGGILVNGNVSIHSATISNNTADSDANGSGLGGGMFLAGTTNVTIANSIVAGNTDHSGAAPDIGSQAGTVSASFSLIGDNTGSGMVEAAPDANGNLIGGPVGGVIDPMLAAMTDNGGSTETHALLAGSPAMNAGDPAFAEPPDFDQRGTGFDRVSSARIDMGAYEWQVLTPGVRLEGGVLEIVGTEEADLVRVSLSGSDLKVRVKFAGGTWQTYFFNAAEVNSIDVQVLDGNDDVRGNRDVAAPMLIDGGAGNDYLRGGDGDDLIRGGTGDDDLRGAKGDDIVLGGDGVDYLNGGSGRDLLIAGLAADTVFGGGGDDLVVGGTTDHDLDDIALAAIRAEWTSGNPLGTRVANIRGGGGLNGSFVLDAATVHADAAIDDLDGHSGADWLWAESIDLVAGGAGDLVDIDDS